MSGEDENVDRDACGDGSDLDTRPSCSNGRRRPPSKSAEKRRLVMRVKYINETSEEDATEMEENSDNSKDKVKSKTNAIQPACNTVENTSEQNLANIPTTKMTKVLTTDSSDINTSDDSCQSDSSNNEAAEKCPICLRSFREQEIGTPAPCEHIFCATCIQAWSKNTPTCPIDRLSFESILVDRSYLNRERVRVIEVLTTKNKNADEDYTDDLSYCAICYEADREDVMLLCDCCNQGYHMDCLSPPISQVPDGLWFCEHCYEDGSVEDRNLHSPNINELFNELDAELGVLVSQVSELRVPRITRTLQNERIRSRVLNDIRQNSRTRRVRKRRRRRRGTARTYVVEYEVNDFDNKFAINTQRKVVRRKRRRRVQTKRNSSGPTSTARARLAEQLGLPPPGSGRDASNLGSSGALSLFGNANDLDYFSDDEDEVTYEDMPTGGGGAAVQTRVRLAQYGVASAIDRKSIFLERQRPRTPPAVMEPVDLLGTIMDLQDRWHTATQRMQDVHINRDGTLALPSSSNTTATTTTTTGIVESDKKATDALPKPTIMEAPMYQRGGHTNFNRGSGNAGGRGNASGGGYNNNRFGNNYSNNNNNSNHYRNVNSGQNSNAGSGGNGDSGDSAGDFSMNRSHLFSAGLTRVPPPQQNNSPFSMRFNQRNPAQQQNQQQQQQQRHSLPFSTPRLPNYNFNNSQTRIQPLFPTQQQQQSQQHNTSVPDLFGGLPPPTTSQGMEQPLFSGLPPPIQQPTNFPHIISVPPPPTPPSGANFSWGPPTAPPTSVFGPISRAEAKCDDAENNQSECPNYAVYTTFSKDNSTKTTKKHESDKDKENDENQEDDEKEEDLVQLDDDDEDGNVDGGGGSSDNLANENIPLPPTEAPAREIDDDAYEPENPTEEDEDEQELEREQQQIADQIVENTNKSDEELEDDMTSKTVALKTADDGDDHGDDDGDDSSDSESDTEKPIENINNNNNNNNNKSPISKENDAVEKTTNRKGVLELYDDSDWEELELEKAKDATTTDTPEATALENPIDRSYTPCLDEPIENEIENVSVSVSEAELETGTTTAKVANSVPAETNALETELISDEEIHTRPAQKPRDSHSKTRSRSKSRPKVRENRRSRSARRGSAERFKKVSNRQKERNYRGITDQKQQNRRVGRNERRRSFATRSRSRSRTPKHTQRYRSRTRSRSLRRPAQRRSRSRSPIVQHHRFSRSPRKRSRTRSPNRRARAFRSRSRGLRSRSRSRSIHNKENARHKNSNNNHNRRNEDKSHNNNNNNRPKRRELPRYDVRNVISNQNQRFTKDRYGRDASRPRSRSGSRERAFVRGRSFSRPPRSRSRTATPQRPPQRVRRASFSMSPTPTPPPLHYGQPSMPRQISLSPLMHYQTPPVGVRYVSPSPMLARINGGRKLPREHSPSPPPPALQHMQRSRTPSLLRLQQVNSFPPRKSRSLSVVAADRLRNKKKKSKERKKKRSEKKTRDNSLMHAKSPSKAEFEVEKVLKKKRRHATSNKHWSPNSPRATPLVNELPAAHEAMGWTPPPRDGERLLMEVRRSLSVESANQLDKHKRQKKKQKTKEKRKEKRRTRRTASNEPPPSKEVFASGNNILVSVSFNKESNTASNALNNNSIPQTTVVTLPAHREDILDKRRRITYDNGKKQRENSMENSNALSMSKKRDKTNRRRTKTDAKPVAIIDLERSPFQVQQDLMDVIVLTDSEDANEKETAKTQRRQSLLSTSAGEEEQPQQQQQQTQQQQQQKSADKAATETLDENYEQTQTTQANVLSNNLLTGPKTPPEPHVVKFNIQNKKTINARSALQEELSDGMSEDEQPTCREEINSTPLNEQTTSSTKMVATDNVITETVVAQKIGPNTPPESAPCSPDAYDPFEPTKSPSISPSSPTPSNSAQTTLNDISTENVSTVSVEMSSKSAEQPQQQLVSSTNSGSVQTHVTNTAATQTSLNAADLVLAFINNKSSNPSNDATHIPGVGDDVISNNNNNNNKHDVGTDGLQVLSNVLLNSPVGASLLGLGNKLTQLPALGGSVGSSSSGMLATGAGGQNISTNNNTSSLLDDSFNITDFDSPYSPGSADYEDLFEPPPDSNKHRGGAAVSAAKRGKADVFDNLFGSSSPPPRHALPNVFSAGSQRKPGNLPVKSKSSRSKDHKSFDEMPNSAVDLQIKDKLLRKLNRQERVVEEVKLVLKPRFNKKQITKDDYKEIMRRAVPKICHSKSGEINPRKIKNLIEAYVKKFRAKHKKLNLLNTGQVSSAVKCAAYLKKL